MSIWHRNTRAISRASDRSIDLIVPLDTLVEVEPTPSRCSPLSHVRFQSLQLVERLPISFVVEPIDHYARAAFANDPRHVANTIVGYNR